MQLRSNQTVIFDHEDCDDINVTIGNDDDGIIQLEQGASLVWIPVADALAFADALKAYAEELVA